MTQRPDAAPAAADQKAKAPADFADTLAELEALVERLESGDLSLESSLENYERGIALVREARGRLSRAELRVQTLAERDDRGPALAPFDEPDAQGGTPA